MALEPETALDTVRQCHTIPCAGTQTSPPAGGFSRLPEFARRSPVSDFGIACGGFPGQGRQGGTWGKCRGDTGKSNVHTGPGLSYKVIGVLRVDDSAKYLEETSVDNRGVVWYKISWKGQKAWVSSRYTRLGRKGGGGKVTGDTVVAEYGDTNVRTGPGLKYRSFDIMYEGDEADYLGKSSTDSRGVVWYKISWYDDVGWVSSKYTELY